MFPSTSVAANLRCNGCRLRVVTAFAASAGVQLQLPNTSRFFPLHPRPRQRQTFATISSRGSEKDAASFSGIESDRNGIKPGVPRDSTPSRVTAAESEPQAKSVRSEPYVPWYLQEHAQHTEQVQNLFSERQRIPDLPEESPPTLLPILQHISTDLGLDDLSILDLRGLDPPPALGSNLIMIVGTARSEKHLHVSADRHCRWLRSTYKLQPFADGLLGRNELKLKLRRKARRSKILRNVGSSEPGQTDEDIRSGWVCVNVGTVEPAIFQMKMQDRRKDSGFVGFGSAVERVRLVVQMFTEEKRGQYDLETLWGGILRRTAREKGKDREIAADLEATNDGSAKQNLSIQSDAQSEDLKEASMIPIPNQSTSLRPWPHFGHQQQSRAFHSGKRTTQGFVPADSHIDDASKVCLESHLPESFLDNFPSFPNITHWQALIELRRRVIEIRGVGRSDAIRAIKAMQEAGEQVPRETYLKMLETMVKARVDRRTLGYVFQILDMMTFEGYSSFEEKTFLLLHEVAKSSNTATAPLDVDHGESSLVTSEAPDAAQPLDVHKDNVLAAMDHFSVPFANDGPWLSLLQFYAGARHWTGFSFLWSALARRMCRRSREMYILFYETLARIGDRNVVKEVLHDAVSDMEVEEPAVQLDREMAELIGRCICVVMPNVKERVSSEAGRVGVGQWGALWGRCQRVLDRSAPK